MKVLALEIFGRKVKPEDSRLEGAGEIWWVVF